jgi:hypothetical protein
MQAPVVLHRQRFRSQWMSQFLPSLPKAQQGKLEQTSHAQQL